LDLGYGAHPNRKELFPVTRFLLTRVVILSNRNRNVSVSVKKNLIRVALIDGFPLVGTGLYGF
jgi:hypothetical protein